MKRIIILCLSLALLACVPTPEEEFVVNKGDDVVERKLNATPKPFSDAPKAAADASDPYAADPQISNAEPTLTAQSFPDRWDAAPVEVLEGFTIAAKADVITKADGLYPVYRTSGATFSKEQAMTFAERMLGEPAAAGNAVMTKAEWGEQLQAYLDRVAEWEQWVAAGKPDWGDREETGYTPEEVDAQTKWYMEQINNAPDERTSDPVRDYSLIQPRTESMYTLADGTAAYIVYYEDSIEISRTAARGLVYRESNYENDKRYHVPTADLWQPVTMDRETAEAMLDLALRQLDLADFSIRSAQKANLREVESEGLHVRCVTTGWSFELHRNPGGYPAPVGAFQPSQELEYGLDEGGAVTKPIHAESIIVLIDENGLQYLMYECPKQIIGVANPNVELLPWEDVRDRVIKSLTMCYPAKSFRENMGVDEIPLEIYRLMLTTFTIQVKNSADYYEMPCWLVYYDGEMIPAFRKMGFDEDWIRDTLERDRNDLLLTHEVLILNAVDGSIVHTEQGY